jgi:tRNA 2-thiouridine synthesizing protein A
MERGGGRGGGSSRALDVAGVVDLRRFACPMTWVRTRLALDRISPGEVLEVVLLAGEPLENVPRTAEQEGHRVALTEARPEKGEGAWRVLLVKGAGTEAEGTMLP